MPSFQSRTIFKYLIVGLLAVLALSYTVEAAPTKPCPIKPGNPAKKLKKRTLVVHPDGKTPVVLFHGTTKAGYEGILKDGFQLSMTNDCGDLHGKDHGVAGGAYFTDSIIAAAQFVIHQDAGKEAQDVAYIMKYQWTPPTGVKVYNFPTILDDMGAMAAQCKTHGMVTSPMRSLPMDKYLTLDFYQYAIVQQSLLDNNLKFLEVIKIPAANVYKGSDLPKEKYSLGQASNPGHADYVTSLVNGCA